MSSIKDGSIFFEGAKSCSMTNKESVHLSLITA